MTSGDRPDMVCLATATNPVQAHIWKHALQQEGVRCRVVGDYLDAGIGDTPGLTGELWVDAAAAARAEAILREHQEPPGEVDSSE